MRRTITRTVRRRNKKRLCIRNIFALALGIMLFTLGYKGCGFFSKEKMEKNKVVAAHTIAQPSKQESIVDKPKVTEAEVSNVKQQQTVEGISNMEKGFNVSKEGEKYTYDAEKVRDMLNKRGQREERKILFLTFDDGPSTTVTPRILDVLKEYDVKATFFLVGRNVEHNEGSKEVLKRAFKEGHAFGNHTYTHDMKYILYPGNKVDVDVFMKEIEKTNIAIPKVIGQDFNTRIIRMPGGHMSRVHFKDPNLAKLDERVEKEKMISIDWNAYDFDSEGKKKTAAQLVDEVKKSVGTQAEVVLLMHDTYGKEETAKALPEVLKYLKGQGYEFRTLK